MLHTDVEMDGAYQAQEGGSLRRVRRLNARTEPPTFFSHHFANQYYAKKWTALSVVVRAAAGKRIKCNECGYATNEERLLCVHVLSRHRIDKCSCKHCGSCNGQCYDTVVNHLTQQEECRKQVKMRAGATKHYQYMDGVMWPTEHNEVVKDLATLLLQFDDSAAVWQKYVSVGSSSSSNRSSSSSSKQPKKLTATKTTDEDHIDLLLHRGDAGSGIVRKNGPVLWL